MRRRNRGWRRRRPKGDPPAVHQPLSPQRQHRRHRVLVRKPSREVVIGESARFDQPDVKEDPGGPFREVRIPHIHPHERLAGVQVPAEKSRVPSCATPGHRMRGRRTCCHCEAGRTLLVEDPTAAEVLRTALLSSATAVCAARRASPRRASPRRASPEAAIGSVGSCPRSARGDGAESAPLMPPALH